jgi:hypothetical protein
MNFPNVTRSARRVGTRIASSIGDAHPFLAGALACLLILGAGLVGTGAVSVYSGPVNSGVMVGDCYTFNVGFEGRGAVGFFVDQC